MTTGEMEDVVTQQEQGDDSYISISSCCHPSTGALRMIKHSLFYRRKYKII